MMITVIDKNNLPVAINSDHVLTISEDPLHKGGIIVDMINGSSIVIPHMTIEEVTAKINLDNNIDKLGKMTDMLSKRISHLEDALVAGLQYVGRSCH